MACVLCEVVACPAAGCIAWRHGLQLLSFCAAALYVCIIRSTSHRTHIKNIYRSIRARAWRGCSAYVARAWGCGESWHTWGDMLSAQVGTSRFSTPNTLTFNTLPHKASYSGAAQIASASLILNALRYQKRGIFGTF